MHPRPCEALRFPVSQGDGPARRMLRATERRRRTDRGDGVVCARSKSWRKPSTR